MPVTISRRQFLAGSLALGATPLALSSRTLQAAPLESSSEARYWALAADTHVSQEPENPARGQNAFFRQTVREILAQKHKPQGFIIAGDSVALEGKPGDYTKLVELLEPLRSGGIDTHISLGNHDNRERCLAACAGFDGPEKPGTLKAGAAWKDCPETEKKSVEVLETPYLNWFLLDSLDKTNVTPGRMDKRQLQWLADELDARKDKPAVLIAHHPIEPLPKSGLLDTAEFLEVIEPRKQVKAFVFGHTHFWTVSRWQDIRLVNLPTTAWLFNDKAPRGWVSAELRDDGMTLTLNTLDHADERNGRRFDVKWER